MLPDKMQVVGIARGAKTDLEIREYFREVLGMKSKHHDHHIDEKVVDKLISRIHYLQGQLDDDKFYGVLKNYLENLSAQTHVNNRIFYLATYPNLYQGIFENLKKSKLDVEDKGFVRLIIEKPIGTDYASAKELNQLLLQYFDEKQIYRLDHYLGKETLQNILTFRFGNEFFEPVMNHEYVDHIQITAAEDLGVGLRGEYYDQVGAFRDVGQNHQLQMIAFTLMEAPDEFNNIEVTAQRIKILNALRPDPTKIVFGQYSGYLDEEKIRPDSKTDTFYALKTFVDTPRWQGVPIYVRAGKKLPEYVTEISIVFKKPVNKLFSHLDCGDQPNILTFRLFPNEGIVLQILTKKPGSSQMLDKDVMQFCYKPSDKIHNLPDPYQRLLTDAMQGDQTFFNDAEEVEAEWKFADAMLTKTTPPSTYTPGCWGPESAEKLIKDDGREWIVPSMEFCRI